MRPEALALASPGTPGTLEGQVMERRYAGPVSYYLVETAPGREVEVLASADAASEGDRVAVPLRGDGPEPRIFPRSEASAPGVASKDVRETGSAAAS